VVSCQGGRPSLALEPICYRRESRLEMIVKKGAAGGVQGQGQADAGIENEGGELGLAVRAGDWQAVERMLLGLLVTTGGGRMSGGEQG